MALEQVKKCEQCLVYFPTKIIHRCLPVTAAVETPRRFRKILPAGCIEKNVLPSSTNDDVEENKVNEFNFTLSLINAVKVRPPLFDHRLPLSERSEFIKNKLWNEVYTELKGKVTIAGLKKKWKYLREKYAQERQQQKNIGINKIGIRRKWLHYAQLSFLEGVVTQFHNKKKATSILVSNLDYSEDSPLSLTTAVDQKRTEENDHDIRRHLRSEPQMPRPPLFAELIKDPYDPDVAFGNYLVSLMKDLPTKKKKQFQCQFVASVISAQDSE